MLAAEADHWCIVRCCFCTVARQGGQLAAMPVGVELLRLKRGVGRAAAVCSFFVRIDEKHILGDFTSKLARYFVLAVDESEQRGVSHQLCGKLKNRITEPTCSVTLKGIDPYDVRSCHRYIYCINWLDALNIELLDQRFFVTECSSTFQGRKELFAQMKQLIDRHAGLLWNYFKKFPLQRHWNRTIPTTPAKRTVIARRYPTPVQFAIASPIFWRGQDTHPNDIRWHWDQLYTKYRVGP